MALGGSKERQIGIVLTAIAGIVAVIIIVSIFLTSKGNDNNKKSDRRANNSESGQASENPRRVDPDLDKYLPKPYKGKAAPPLSTAELAEAQRIALKLIQEIATFRAGYNVEEQNAHIAELTTETGNQSVTDFLNQIYPDPASTVSVFFQVEKIHWGMTNKTQAALFVDGTKTTVDNGAVNQESASYTVWVLRVNDRWLVDTVSLGTGFDGA
jgi:hypothetical protein